MSLISGQSYDTKFLKIYPELPSTPMQLEEDLEQLKVLENGYKMKVKINFLPSFIQWISFPPLPHPTPPHPTLPLSLKKLSLCPPPFCFFLPVLCNFFYFFLFCFVSFFLLFISFFLSIFFSVLFIFYLFIFY